ncbi:MAG: hypothetical protein R3F50_01405 [Gammaproteobacteria bacterium]|jgi:hypothetical protein
MSRPAPEELKTALQRAAWLREHNQDEYFLAKSPMSHDYRLKFLEHVLQAAKIYLHSGNGARGHSELLRAIAKAEQTEACPGVEPHLENHDVIL